MRPDQDKVLEELFRQHFNELEIYAYALLGDRNNASVAVQDAFHTACEKIDDVMRSPNPAGWMKLTVKNIARNMIKRRNRELRLVMPIAELSTEPGKWDPDEFEFWNQCKSLVTKEEMALIISIVVEDTPYAEKAKEMGISVWACYKRVERALDKLRRGLEYEK